MGKVNVVVVGILEEDGLERMSLSCYDSSRGINLFLFDKFEVVRVLC